MGHVKLEGQSSRSDHTELSIACQSAPPRADNLSCCLQKWEQRLCGRMCSLFSKDLRRREAHRGTKKTSPVNHGMLCVGASDDGQEGLLTFLSRHSRQGLRPPRPSIPSCIWSPKIGDVHKTFSSLDHALMPEFPAETVPQHRGGSSGAPHGRIGEVRMHPQPPPLTRANPLHQNPGPVRAKNPKTTTTTLKMPAGNVMSERSLQQACLARPYPYPRSTSCSGTM